MSKIGDYVRENLVTIFVCAKCGHNLTISYGRETPDNSRMTEGEPTGAAMVKNLIHINPCEYCLKPAKDAELAMRMLIDLGTKDD